MTEQTPNQLRHLAQQIKADADSTSPHAALHAVHQRIDDPFMSDSPTPESPRSNRSRIVWTAVAAALVVIGGIGIAALLATRGDINISAVDDPATQPDTSLPDTTEPAPDTDEADIGEPWHHKGWELDADGRPTHLIALTGDQRLVRINVATGEEVEELDRFDNMADWQANGTSSGEPFAGGRFFEHLTDRVGSDTGARLIFSTCCEPAVGAIFGLPFTTEGAPAPLTPYGSEGGVMGVYPTMFPDGSSIAAGVFESIEITPLLSNGLSLTIPMDLACPPEANCTPFSPGRMSTDGRYLAVEAHAMNSTRIMVVDLSIDPNRDSSPRVVTTVVSATRDGIMTHPVIDRFGRLHVVDSPAPDPGTDAPTSSIVRTYDLDTGLVLDGNESSNRAIIHQSIDASGQHILRTFSNGMVTASRVSTDSFIGDQTPIDITGIAMAAW